MSLSGLTGCGGEDPHEEPPLSFDTSQPDVSADDVGVDAGPTPTPDVGSDAGPDAGPPPPPPPPSGRIEYLALDERQVDVDDLWEVAFDIVEGVRSFTLLVEAVAPAHADIWVSTVRDPDDEVLYDVREGGAELVIITPYTTGGQMGLMLPNTPEVPLKTGRYTVELWADDTTLVKSHVLFKRGPVNPTGGKLALNLWFTEQNILGAQAAGSDADFQAAMEALRSVYAQVGVAVDTVDYFDIEGALAQSLAVPRDDEKACAEIRELPIVGDPSAINIVFIEHDNFDYGPVMGLSCGVPGLPSYPGITRSGVMLSLDYLREDAAMFGDTIAHEIAHFLGLFHTSEDNGMEHDPLLDTPECTTAQDTNGDGTLSSEECIDHGADNNMFWSSFADGSRSTLLTSDQRFVLMNNPLIETFE
ncbi:MAG: hypothetical protein ACNA8W_20815 [Bradymonadaceae bacterium]